MFARACVCALAFVAALSADRAWAQAGPRPVTGTAIDLDADEARTVEGRVVDAAGVPVAGVPIFTYNLARKPAAATDAAGRFRFVLDDARGTAGCIVTYSEAYALKARGPDGTIARAIVRHPRASKMPAPRDLLLQLGPATALSGRIVRADGAPVAGASLNLQEIVEIDGRRVAAQIVTTTADVSAADGSFRAEGLAPGTRIWMQTYVPPLDTNAELVVDVGVGPVTDVTWTVPATRVVHARVVDADGQPAFAGGNAMLDTFQGRGVTIGGDGSLALPYDGTKDNVQLCLEGARSPDLAVAHVPVTAEAVLLRLPRTVTLSATLRVADGGPNPERVTVHASGIPGRPGWRMWIEAPVDAAGVAIAAVPAGAAHLEFSSWSFPGNLVASEIRAEPDGSLSVNLAPPPLGIVTGHVVAASGQVAGRQLVLTTQGGGLDRIRTVNLEADGSFRFIRVPPGHYLFRLQGRWLGEVDVSAGATADGIELRWPP